MTEKIVYIFDASSFIDLKEMVSRDFFSPLFNSLESMIISGNLISNEEILEELIRKDDDISRWAKKQRGLFIELDNDQIEKAREILKKFPKLIDENKKNNADPFLIALAIIKEQQRLVQTKYIVVTEESMSSKPNKPKIPNVCRYYKIDCINLNDFLKKELEIKIEFKNNKPS